MTAENRLTSSGTARTIAKVAIEDVLHTREIGDSLSTAKYEFLTEFDNETLANRPCLIGFDCDIAGRRNWQTLPLIAADAQ